MVLRCGLPPEPLLGPVVTLDHQLRRSPADGRDRCLTPMDDPGDEFIALRPGCNASRQAGRLWLGEGGELS